MVAALMVLSVALAIAGIYFIQNGRERTGGWLATAGAVALIIAVHLTNGDPP
jgi:hypothetical protein